MDTQINLDSRQPAKFLGFSKETIIIASVIGTVFIIILCLLVLIGISFFVSKQNTVIRDNVTVSPSINNSLMPTAKPIVLENNTIYYAKYKGQNILFLHNGSERNFNQTSAEVDGTTLEGENIEFSDLTDIKLVYTGGKQQEIYLNNFVIQSDSIFFVMDYGIDKDYEYPTVSAVYKFNFNKNVGQIIFSKSTDKSSTHDKLTWSDGSISKIPNNGGAFSIEMIEDDYLALRVPKCYGCDETPPGNLLVVNLKSQLVKDYGMVGAERMNSESKEIIFKGYVSAEGPCIQDPAANCTEYRTTGKEDSGTLP